MKSNRVTGGLPAASMAASMMMLTACNPSGGSAPGAVSEGEASALEDAAEMLDERQLPEGVLPPIDAPTPDEAREASEAQEIPLESEVE